MSKRPVKPDDDDMLAAEYALGVMQEPDRRTFEARLSTEPALRARLRAWDEHFTHFADAIEPVEPPASLQKSLETRLFGKPDAKPGFWHSLALWRGLAFTSCAALLALGVYTTQVSISPSGGDALVAEVRGESNAVTLAAYYDEAKGELRVNRVAGTAAAGRSFELWLIVGNDPPVSLGVLPDAATTRLAVPQALRSKFRGGVLAISDEPKGGSTTGAPTGAVVATGKLTVI